MKTNEIKILCTILLSLLLIFIPNLVKANASTVELESITVTSPKTGIYNTGEKITMVAKYTDEIEGKGKINIRFGEAGTTRTVEGTIKGNTITYEYVIEKKDSGKLVLAFATSSDLKDKEGNYIENKSVNLTGSEITANPITWTDTSKFNYKIDSNYQLNITGITEIEEHHYYIFITKSKEEPELVLGNGGFVQNYDFLSLKFDVKDYLEKSGDIYLWICEQQKNYGTNKQEQKFIVIAKKIERPIIELGKRIYIASISDDTRINLLVPHNKENKRNIKLKIGQITDRNLLNSIQNKEKNSMEKLLSYAKDTKAIYNGTVEADKTKNGNIADNMELIDNAYYYVYFVLDNENGKYYPVEDVNIVQANIDSVRAKKWFATDIHWTKDEDIKKPEEPAKQEQPKVEDTTQAKGQLPKTGIICVELVVGILFVLSTIIFALKYKKYKEI